jgi:hypothetical protein
LENLRTEGLTLVALKPELTPELAPELTQVALEDGAKLEPMLGARVSEAWPGADCATILPRIARGIEQAGVDPTRLIVHTANRTLNRTLIERETGFYGPPDGSGR